MRHGCLGCPCSIVTNRFVREGLFVYSSGCVWGFAGMLSWLQELFALSGGVSVSPPPPQVASDIHALDQEEDRADDKQHKWHQHRDQSKRTEA